MARMIRRGVSRTPQFTNEGGKQYEHSLNHALEFFSKAGSLFENRESFYDNEESALSLFQKSWIVDKVITMKLLLWLRDCRGGAGNRSGARKCMEWLAKNDPVWLDANIGWIPMIGRWDDLRVLFGTDLEKISALLWAEAIRKKDVLAAKWADRKDVPIQRIMECNEAGLRKLLAKLRKDHIVEAKMCSGNWEAITYEHVPSVAMARYTKAFGRNDEDRFSAYKEALASGKTTIKADVLFPHDCVRTSIHGDRKIADAQFEALPNFMEGADERIIVISDTSGSMDSIIAGMIRAVDISQGLALYCSAKMPKNSPFYKKFIGFCSESKFKDWNGMTFSQAIRDRSVFDGAYGGTQIDTALDLILKTAKFFSLPQEFMPTTLLIVSDMQFHPGQGLDRGRDGSEVEAALSRWVNAGYKPPKVLYWNTSGYAGSPATVNKSNVGLISGFSPAILKAVFSGTDFSPLAIMMRALEKYDIVIPK